MREARRKTKGTTTKKRMEPKRSGKRTGDNVDGAVSHHSWAEMEEEWLNPTISRKLVVGKREMLGYVTFKKGAVVPAHRHTSEQITYVLKGVLKFAIREKDYSVKGGEVLVIPSNLVHEAVAMEDTDSLDCFSPLRKDWLTGKDQYLRTGRSFLKGGR
jgi:quercetin dioxygenase-like cupin family protein